MDAKGVEADMKSIAKLCKECKDKLKQYKKKDLFVRGPCDADYRDDRRVLVNADYGPADGWFAAELCISCSNQIMSKADEKLRSML